MENTGIKSAQYYQDKLNNVLTSVMPFDWHMAKETDVDRALELYSDSKHAVADMINELQKLQCTLDIDIASFIFEWDN